MPTPSLDGLCIDSVLNVSKPTRTESETSVFKEMDVEVDAKMEKYDYYGDWGRIIFINKVSALMNEKRRQ